MGHAVADEACRRGHSVVAAFDRFEDLKANSAKLLEADVAIEFTSPSSAAENIKLCVALGMPVVSGTTGWYDDYRQVAAGCKASGGRMLTATNFSVGMNIMFAINKRLAQVMCGHDEYKVGIREVHHVHKLDAPSGTAISLCGQIEQCMPGVDVPIESVREGEVPGVHTVSYTSEADTITLTHEAHGRQGLAQGAVLAAEWLVSAKPGVYTMNDVLKL